MVMNVGRFLSGDFDYVVDDIRAVVRAARSGGADVKVKVIQESALLSAEQIAVACELSLLAGADFVKTSTGFGRGGATPEIIAVMLRAVGGKMGVKASGGIRDWATATAYLRQGVDRLGVGATEAVLAGGGVLPANG
jgi:deoxyribose-phosphate aldolase